MTADSQAPRHDDHDADRSASGTLKTILVPLDGSSTAEAVLPLVEATAARLRTRVILVAVHQPGQASRGAIGIPSVDQRVDEEARAAMGRYLHDVAQRLRGQIPLIDMVVLQGDPSDRIATYAERTGVGLLAIASHGRGGVNRLWLGSVTDRLLRHVNVPMLVVHARPLENGAAAARPIRRALVPLDGTPEAEEIFTPLTQLLAGLEVQYTLVRAAGPWNPLARAVSSQDEMEHDLAAQHDEVRAYLEGAAARLHALVPAVSTMISVGDDAAREILAAVGLLDADLLAMTTRGYGTLGRALIGSVADKAMRGSPVPVLLRRVVRRDAESEPVRQDTMHVHRRS